MNGGTIVGGGLTYEPQGDDANDIHEDVAAFTEDDSVEGDKRLRRAE